MQIIFHTKETNKIEVTDLEFDQPYYLVEGGPQKNASPEAIWIRTSSNALTVFNPKDKGSPFGFTYRIPKDTNGWIFTPCESDVKIRLTSKRKKSE